MDKFKYEVIRIIETLIDDIYELRENGETDLRTVLRYAEGAKSDIKRLEVDKNGNKKTSAGC